MGIKGKIQLDVEIDTFTRPRVDGGQGASLASIPAASG